MTHTDRDGNQVVSRIQAYFQQLMGAARPLRDFPVSLCAQFQEGLDVRLAEKCCTISQRYTSTENSQGLPSGSPAS
jgi:hypothetical protein